MSAEHPSKSGHEAILALNEPWKNNSNNIWMASTISLKRNIEKFNFPKKLNVERKKQIVSLVGKEHLSLESLKNPLLLKADELNILDREYLVEHFLTMNSFHQMGVGEAFMIDESGEILTVFNLSDHLTFMKVFAHNEFERGWNQLMKLETSLGKKFSYSSSQRFGFLTSDFSKCGTALTVASYLQIPALIHTEKIDDFLEAQIDESISITGIQGNPTEIIGDILVIQNEYTLGISEENIFSAVRAFSSRLVSEEKMLRLSFLKTQNPDIMDRVSRAFAVLRHSYQIEAVEALNAISLIKLGLEMGWVDGVTMESLNQLFFTCRRAHLLYQFNGKIAQEEIPHKRAEYIHKALSQMKLLIE